MAYDYSPKTLIRWPMEAQAAAYRLKYLHELRRAAYWQQRALAAESQTKDN